MKHEVAWKPVEVSLDRTTGASPRHAGATDPDKLAALIADRTRPALSVHVEIVDLGGRALLIIQVPPQRQTVGTSDGVFLRRNIGGDGRPAPSYARSDSAVVMVVIPGGEANLDFVRLLVTEAQGGLALGLDELLILNALWRERSLETSDAAGLTQKPEAETRATLHRLVEAGLVEERGQKKGRTWHLSAAAYRALGDKAAYVRQRGFEPLQQAQMVLQYVEKHGGSPGERRRSFAVSRLIRPIACSPA